MYHGLWSESPFKVILQCGKHFSPIHPLLMQLFTQDLKISPKGNLDEETLQCIYNIINKQGNSLEILNNKKKNKDSPQKKEEEKQR